MGSLDMIESVSVHGLTDNIKVIYFKSPNMTLIILHVGAKLIRPYSLILQ